MILGDYLIRVSDCSNRLFVGLFTLTDYYLAPKMWLSVAHWFSVNSGNIWVTKSSGSTVMTQFQCCIALQITMAWVYLSLMSIDIFTSPGF